MTSHDSNKAARQAQRLLIKNATHLRLAQSQRAGCGFQTDCPRTYTLASVIESAARRRDVDPVSEAALRMRHDAARRDCERQASGVVGALMGMTSGAWCLAFAKPVNATGWGSRRTATGQFLVRAAREKPRVIELPNGMTYALPHGHVEADSGFVEALYARLAAEKSPTPSLSDFGAGVGQYGRALLARDPSFPWRGFDAAGDVVAFTDGFVDFIDLTLPSLSLPVTDWVMSLEVRPAPPPQSHRRSLSPLALSL